MKANLKETICHILQRLNAYTKVVETQTFTALGKPWVFRRIGNVVYIDAPLDSDASISAGVNTIGTLGASMRPAHNTYLKCTNINDDVRLFIFPDGTVSLYTPYAWSGLHNCGFSGMSYIVGGVLRNPVIAILSAIGGGLNEGHSQRIADRGVKTPIHGNSRRSWRAGNSYQHSVDFAEYKAIQKVVFHVSYLGILQLHWFGINHIFYRAKSKLGDICKLDRQKERICSSQYNHIGICDCISNNIAISGRRCAA